MDHQPPYLTRFARQLRREPSEAERQLWLHMRSRQIAGAKFRRQVPIGPYIADFCCFEPPVIVELDGGQHAHTVLEDRARSRYLEDRGFKVLRFWNNQLRESLEGVLLEISVEIERSRQAATKGRIEEPPAIYAPACHIQ